MDGPVNEVHSKRIWMMGITITIKYDMLVFIDGFAIIISFIVQQDFKKLQMK